MEQPKPFGKMTTPVEEALTALGMLLEGASVRSTERLTGLHRDSILRLLVAAGEKCEKLMGRLLVNIPVKDLQCDEIWSYVSKKEAHKLPAEKENEGIGDAYCYVAIERHHKLVINFTVGRRNQPTTDTFIEGVRHATIPGQRFQITTDGFQPYISAITTTLSDRCDYAQHIKVYGQPEDGERRYSPAEVISSEKVPVMGNPEKSRICTSHVERQNLTYADADPAVHSADKCLLKEVGEPLGCAVPVLRLLQFLPRASDLARYACDGSGAGNSDLESGRFAFNVTLGHYPGSAQEPDHERRWSALPHQSDHTLDARTV